MQVQLLWASWESSFLCPQRPGQSDCLNWDQCRVCFGQESSRWCSIHQSPGKQILSQWRLHHWRIIDELVEVLWRQTKHPKYTVKVYSSLQLRTTSTTLVTFRTMEFQLVYLLSTISLSSSELSGEWTDYHVLLFFFFYFDCSLRSDVAFPMETVPATMPVMLASIIRVGCVVFPIYWVCLCSSHLQSSFAEIVDRHFTLLYINNLLKRHLID